MKDQNKYLQPFFSRPTIRNSIFFVWWIFVGALFVFLLFEKLDVERHITKVEKNCFSDTIQYSVRYSRYRQLKNEHTRI